MHFNVYIHWFFEKKLLFKTAAVSGNNSQELCYGSKIPLSSCTAELNVLYNHSLCQDQARMYFTLGRSRAARKCIQTKEYDTKLKTIVFSVYFISSHT